MLILLSLHLLILSGVISPLISSSILVTYRPGEFIYQYPIFLPFRPVQVVFKARILNLEPDILECDVKWALESITMNKASGVTGFQ